MPQVEYLEVSPLDAPAPGLDSRQHFLGDQPSNHRLGQPGVFSSFFNRLSNPCAGSFGLAFFLLMPKSLAPLPACHALITLPNRVTFVKYIIALIIGADK